MKSNHHRKYNQATAKSRHIAQWALMRTLCLICRLYMIQYKAMFFTKFNLWNYQFALPGTYAVQIWKPAYFPLYYNFKAELKQLKCVSSPKSMFIYTRYFLYYITATYNMIHYCRCNQLQHDCPVYMVIHSSGELSSSTVIWWKVNCF